VPQAPARARSTRPRPGDRSRTDRARPPKPRSDDRLERALAEAAAAPEPTHRGFGQFGLPQELVTVLARRGLAEPFAIQTRVLPDALTGRDILGRASTGSGKTLAFGIPVLARLAGNRAERRAGTSDRKGGRPRAVIVVPTRELARQVSDVLAPLAHALELRVTTVVGGLPINKQIDAVRRGVDVVVATPGRLLDLMERGACSLDEVEITVLDEADHLADLGFLPDVRRILDATPKGIQRMLLSATLDRGVDRVVHDYLLDPAIHAVAQAPDEPQVMDHRVLVLRAGDKASVAAEIAARPGRTLFFVRTRHGADRLAKSLGQAGVEAAAIHGDRSQSQRQRALDAFSGGRPRVLVATDVAARGIHVDDVDLVVHYDLPADHKDYLHRSGRTARAGASGTVVAFTEHWQRRDLQKLHRAAGVTPTSTVDDVIVGDPAVRELAESGTPIVVTAPAPRADRERRRDDRPRRQGRPQGGPSHGQGPRRGPARHGGGRRPVRTA
jgi:superfamily II DNA/RNA helicase